MILINRKMQIATLWVSIHLLSGCKHAGLRSAVKDADVGQANALSASDLSILFPLKSNKSTGDFDVFRKAGDGFQNAPGLDLGGDVPILSEGLFQSFVDDAFGGNGNVKGSCKSPVIDAEDFDRADGDLLPLAKHLAMIRGIDTRICDYKVWRVVGFRFDPCLERPLVKDLHTLNAMPASCKSAEARLIVQPFAYYAGAWTAIDGAMHLIYHAPDIQKLVLGLRKIRQASDRSVETYALPAGFSRSLLTPHPGLWAEMEIENGPVATEIRTFLTSFTNEERLSGIAWMTSSRGSMQWSFGTRKVVGRKLKPNANQTAESFSSSVFSHKKIPFSPMSSGVLNIAAYYDIPGHGGQVSDDGGRLNDISNPLIVSQILSGERSSTCVSCHMTDQTMQRLNISLSRPSMYPGPRPYVGHGSATNLTWKSLKKRSFHNLRNFGYGPGFVITLSQRAIHEADDLVETIERFYNKPDDIEDPVSMPQPGTYEEKQSSPIPLPPTRFGN